MSLLDDLFALFGYVPAARYEAARRRLEDAVETHTFNRGLYERTVVDLSAARLRISDLQSEVLRLQADLDAAPSWDQIDAPTGATRTDLPGDAPEGSIEAWLLPDGGLVITGVPRPEEHEGLEHDCDVMGCGLHHVLQRRPPDLRPRVAELEAQLAQLRAELEDDPTPDTAEEPAEGGAG